MCFHGMYGSHCMLYVLEYCGHECTWNYEICVVYCTMAGVWLCMFACILLDVYMCALPLVCIFWVVLSIVYGMLHHLSVIHTVRLPFCGSHIMCPSVCSWWQNFICAHGWFSDPNGVLLCSILSQTRPCLNSQADMQLHFAHRCTISQLSPLSMRYSS